MIASTEAQWKEAADLLNDSEDLHNDSFSSLPVKLGVEDALPGAEVRAAPRNGQRRFVMQEKRFEVSIAVILAGPVVLIIGSRWGKFLEPFADVLDQADFEVIHVNRGCDVHGRNEAQAVFYSAAFHNLLHLVGDVHHFLALARFKSQIFCVALHARLLAAGAGMAAPALNLYPKESRDLYEYKGCGSAIAKGA